MARSWREGKSRRDDNDDDTAADKRSWREHRKVLRREAAKAERLERESKQRRVA